MEISLDRDSSRPVYRQIASELGARIESGELAAGERLPPIRRLAEQLGVNRDTVALAYDELAGSGAVTARVGRGTFVMGEVGEFPPAREAPARIEPALSSAAARLIEFERARPAYGQGGAAVAMQELAPDPDLYPLREFRSALSRVLIRDGGALLGYGDPRGDRRLREALSKRLVAHGVPTEADELVVTQGATQGISTVLRVFAEPGSSLAVEEPTYANVIASVLAEGLRPAPVPMIGSGVDLGALARVLARPEVRAFYTIPTFHNPMGVTTGLAHRRALLEIAAQAGKPVIEDAYEMDLRFRGPSVASLAALDTRGLVVQLLSFSKSLFPGARAGAVRAQGRTLEALIALRRAADLGGSPLLQAALAEFLEAGHYDRHLARLRRHLRRRFRVAFEALGAEMPSGATWTRPEGGYQIWVRLPEGIDARHLLPEAARHGVLFVPGDQFYYPARVSRELRLSIAKTPEAEIRAGVRALGRAVRAVSTRPRPQSARVQL